MLTERLISPLMQMLKASGHSVGQNMCYLGLNKLVVSQVPNTVFVCVCVCVFTYSGSGLG